tara:strand:- start:147 stop:506 length:360 start_codon:yes stop_codon:yes gene_type:complete
MSFISNALENLNVTLEWAANPDSIKATDIQWLTTGSRPTDTQIQTEIDRLVAAQPMTLLRYERNARLAACDWRACSDVTLSDDWKTYRQALRDLPATASPKLDSYGELDLSSVTFPTEP